MIESHYPDSVLNDAEDDAIFLDNQMTIFALTVYFLRNFCAAMWGSLECFGSPAEFIEKFPGSARAFISDIRVYFF